MPALKGIQLAQIERDLIGTKNVWSNKKSKPARNHHHHHHHSRKKAKFPWDTNLHLLKSFSWMIKQKSEQFS